MDGIFCPCCTKPGLVRYAPVFGVICTRCGAFWTQTLEMPPLGDPHGHQLFPGMAGHADS